MILSMDFSLHHFSKVSSTNEIALELLAKGYPAGTVILADEQTAGRGTNGRTWVSPRGNLYVSLIVYPKTLQGLTIEVAKILQEILKDYVTYKDLRIKEPNDILLDGKKISGILLESQLPEPGVVIGIGLNIKFAPIPDITTCLLEHMPNPPTISEVLQKILLRILP